jgi:hypothetical protein
MHLSRTSRGSVANGKNYSPAIYSTAGSTTRVSEEDETFLSKASYALDCADMRNVKAELHRRVKTSRRCNLD